MSKHFSIALCTILGTAALIGCGGTKDSGLPDNGTVGIRILGSWAVKSVTFEGDTAECPGGSLAGYSCPKGNVIFRTDGTAEFDNKSITYGFFDNVLRIDTTPSQFFDVEFINKSTGMIITSRNIPDASLTLEKVTN